MNPILKSTSSNDKKFDIMSHYHTKSNILSASSCDMKQQLLRQIKPPLTKYQPNKLSPWVVVSGNKIIKYDLKKMSIWRALIMYQYTILKLPSTYYLLGYLTILCFIVEAIVYFSEASESIDTTISIFSRVNMLLSFVLASYVSICISRWDNLRQNMLGRMWGALENMNVHLMKILSDPKEDPIEKYRILDKMLRYSKLMMRLVFLCAQEQDDMTVLVKDKLLTIQERDWLQAALMGTRPMLVIGMISRFVDDILSERPDKAAVYAFQTNGVLLEIKGGFGAMFGVLGCPLPFAYVHAIYWVVQVSLVVLSVETGVTLAVNSRRKLNGNGDYTNAVDDYTWPNSPDSWYWGGFLQITLQNVFFAVFLIGLLKICEKISNPLSAEFMSFPEHAYEAFIHNNIMALRIGESIGSSSIMMKDDDFGEDSDTMTKNDNHDDDNQVEMKNIYEDHHDKI